MVYIHVQCRSAHSFLKFGFTNSKRSDILECQLHATTSCCLGCAFYFHVLSIGCVQQVNRPLPDDLWGPFCNVRNGYANEMTIDDHEFVLVDRCDSKIRQVALAFARGRQPLLKGALITETQTQSIPFNNSHLHMILVG